MMLAKVNKIGHILCDFDILPILQLVQRTSLRRGLVVSGGCMPDYMNSLLPIISLAFSCFGLGFTIGYFRGKDRN